MKTILKNVTLMPELGYGKEPIDLAVEGTKIARIGANIAHEAGDETVECKGNLLIPAFYNAHCHAAMTLFRGYGEDLPLQRWLDEKILPAEELLTYKSVYVASKVAIAEMIRNGIVSFTDMYMFEDATAEAVIETGVKANLSRNLVSFDPDIDIEKDYRYLESVELAKNYQNAADGRVKIDYSLHAEYSNVPKYVAALAEKAKEAEVRIQLHLSETEKEHNDCIRRHGKTPARFFYDLGVFDVPVTAAHCVYVTDEDMAILKEKGVFAAHDPISNLKLGSGVMPLRKMLDAGVRVAMATDGTASNNRLDILKEAQTAVILQKGITRDPAITVASEMLQLATRNGALSQGRDDCGEIRIGNRADLVLIDRSALHNKPCFDEHTMLMYSAESRDVLMTMADGRILYRNGEYTSIDEERLSKEFDEVLAHYFA